jgi:hypothetical protein
MTAPERVAQSVRRSRQWAAASLVLGCVAMVTTNIMLVIGACGGWLLALIALVFALTAIVRNAGAPAEEQASIGRLSLIAGVVPCVALFLGQTLIVQAAWRAAWNTARTSISAANLRGIGNGVAAYADECKAYPPSLQELLSSGGMTPMTLCAPLDPDYDWRGSSQPGVVLIDSSYIYVPGHGTRANDPRVIIAYERRAFGSSRLRILQTPERCVLFDDGRVEILDESAFQRAWQQDHQRRRELGWPIAASEPARPPASQPGPVVTWPAG